MDVATPELGFLRLGEEVAQHSGGPTAEVEDALAAPRPVLGKEGFHCRADKSAYRVVTFQRIAWAPAHASDEFLGRQRS